MSDKKQFFLVMVVAAVFVSWLGWRGFEVITLNGLLKSDPVVSGYPYQHRVLRVEGDIAIMSSLRSHNVSTHQALGAVYPSMKNLAEGDKSWQRAERELAQIQARAGDIILGAEGIRRIRWELDENWYHIQSMKSDYDTEF
ncbi:hypothetical protein LPB19_15550 [Marinobacter salinisoli]|uniref:Uncharacterized protein n=1 Tax=Marinobacter salinisoli TaxID=2769486 RepID=A0ABX7MQG8_9GAMM|nr:hypothetical protein [Marinobacter salinisoli]QSP94566.1 hypothetical protein LPB19_15550 [Marinobacter salinisoli]